MRNPAQPAAFLALAVLCTLLGACTSSEKSARTAELQAKIQACELFPDDLAVRVSGESVARMTSTLEDAGKPDPAQCVYNSGTLEKPRILSLLVRSFNDAESTARVESDSRVYLARLAGRPVVRIAGLGDGALWAGGKVQQLHVRRGPVQLLITVQSPDGSEQLAEARTIAAQALAKLEPILAAHAASQPPAKAGS